MNSWKLTDEHINLLQIAGVDEVIKRAKQAHYVDIHIRINGTWEKYEGDWIKHLKREDDTANTESPCQHDLLRPNPTIVTWVEKNIKDILMQMARCPICHQQWEWPVNTAQTERIQKFLLSRHAPKEDCPKLIPKDECHLECCSEYCEGDGCAKCGPDV